MDDSLIFIAPFLTNAIWTIPQKDLHSNFKIPKKKDKKSRFKKKDKVNKVFQAKTKN